MFIFSVIVFLLKAAFSHGSMTLAHGGKRAQDESFILLSFTRSVLVKSNRKQNFLCKLIVKYSQLQIT